MSFCSSWLPKQRLFFVFFCQILGNVFFKGILIRLTTYFLLLYWPSEGERSSHFLFCCSMIYFKKYITSKSHGKHHAVGRAVLHCNYQGKRTTSLFFSKNGKISHLLVEKCVTFIDMYH